MGQTEVPAEAAGERLDAFLGEQLGSRSAAARLITAGGVTVNGRAVQKRHAVSPGEQIEWSAELPPAAPAEVVPQTTPAAHTIVFEDEHLLVVDKPAGVVVHPGKGNWEGTLAQALGGQGGDEERPGIVHRLDKDTSGLLVVAKSEASHRRLKDLISTREVTREYLTLVAGLPEARTGTIEAPIGRDRHSRIIMSLDTDSPRDARTHFAIVEAFDRDTLLRVTLDTGRTHQIRVHMQAIGHPVIGDPTYGGPVRYGLDRQFLHAARLAFTHPMTSETVDISSELPADLALGLTRARGS